MSEGKQLSNTTVKDANFLTVPISEILIDQANNSRKFTPDPKKLKVLSADLQVRGQMFPLLVVDRNGAITDESPQKYELRDGFRRAAALLMAQEETGAVINPIIRVFSDEGALEGYKLSMAANSPALRENPSLMEQAYQIVELKSKGVQGKEIAAEMGMSGSWVTTVAKFVTLRPEIQKQIHLGTLPWTVARNLVDQDEAAQDKTLAQLAEKSAGGESATEIAAGNRTKKKSKRGRKAKGAGEEGSGKKPPSMKVLAAAAEEYSVEPVAEEGKAALKESKADETFRLIFKTLGKFATGKIGQQAMAKQIRNLL